MRSIDSRPYRMRRRAEQVEETRQRIVEAAVLLHGTAGPASTTIAAIAETAGVTRLTVYRHFPDDVALYSACSAHWLSQQVVPDPSAWQQISDPAERLRAGLADLYRFYRDGQAMLTRVYRDKAAMPEPIRLAIESEDQHRHDVLLEVFAVRGAVRRRLSAVLGHAVSFWTWHSLAVKQELSDQEVVDVMSRLVLSTTD